MTDAGTPPLARRLLAELLGSAFLAALVIGSGIAAQTLSPGNVGLQLFENAAATAAGLFTIILMFGPISGGTSTRSLDEVDLKLKWSKCCANGASSRLGQPQGWLSPRGSRSGSCG